MLIANNLPTRVNCNFLICVLETVSKVDGKFALTILSTPNIIVPVFSEQQQQHCLSIITILAAQIKHNYLRTTIGGNILD